MPTSRNHLLQTLTNERSHFLGFVRRRVVDLAEVDPEDLVQDVIYNLFNKGDLVFQVENLAAYVYRSLANRILEYRRSRRLAASLDTFGSDSDSSSANHPPASAPDPLQMLEKSEARQVLNQALAALPKEQREIWLATEVDGQTFREIAQASGVPIGTLLSRKNRATQAITQYARQRLGLDGELAS